MAGFIPCLEQDKVAPHPHPCGCSFAAHSLMFIVREPIGPSMRLLRDMLSAPCTSWALLMTPAATPMQPPATHPLPSQPLHHQTSCGCSLRHARTPSCGMTSWRPAIRSWSPQSASTTLSTSTLMRTSLHLGKEVFVLSILL